MGKLRRAFFVLGAALAGSAFVGFGCMALADGTRHTLKDNGKVECEIVVPDGAGPVALFAGKEMQKYLSQSLGGEVPLVKAPGGIKTSIILGNSQQLREAGVDVAKLPRDGFVIKSSGNNILVAGRDDPKAVPEKEIKRGGYWGNLYERGTLFAAYEFLERLAGVRFYFPGEMGTIVPKRDKLQLGELDISEKPDLEVRKVSWAGPGVGAIDWTPNEKEEKSLAALRMRLETKYIPNCHGLAHLGYVARFGKTNPEYFALLPDGRRYTEDALPHTGQLCLSSGIREEIYKDAVSFLTGRPASERGVKTKWGVVWSPSGFQPGYFNIMPQDSFYECKCEKCQAHFSKGPQATSDFVWGLVNEVANRLKKDKIPGNVTMMAYTPYRMLPSEKIPDNVMVMVAVGGPWYMDKGDTFKKEAELVRAWTEKMYGNKPWLWNYTCKFAKLAIPNVPGSTPRAVGEYYKKMGPHIIGAFMESGAESDEIGNYMFNYLNFYVFGKVAWKNSTDVDALLKEHHRLMFGGAAAQMEKVFDAFEEKWMKIAGKPIDTPLGPQTVPLSDYDIWEKVYSKAEMARLDGLFDESEKATAQDADSNKRVKFMRERFLQPLKKQRGEYEKNQVAINDLRFQVKELAPGEKVSVDGKIDEAAWKNAARITLAPYATERTKKETGIKTAARALRDAENLYFAFECEEPEMDKIMSSKRAPDDKEIWKDSSVEIFLNPSADRNTYYQLLVNADGSLSDLSATKEGGIKAVDLTWNSGAVSAAAKGAKSWTVEVAVPLKSLPGLSLDKDFPANFNRSRVLLKSSQDYASLFTWSPFLRGGFHDIDNFGYITFKDSKSLNVIRNSSFQGTPSGRFFDGWYFAEATGMKPFESWAVVEDPFTESGKCVKLSRTSAEKGALSATQYLPDLKPDTDYLLSFSVKIDGLALMPGSRSGGVVVNIWDDKNTWWPKGFYTSDMPWSRQGFQIRTGPDTNKKVKSYLRLTIMDAACAASFGDVKLTETCKDKKI